MATKPGFVGPLYSQFATVGVLLGNDEGVVEEPDPVGEVLELEPEPVDEPDPEAVEDSPVPEPVEDTPVPEPVNEAVETDPVGEALKPDPVEEALEPDPEPVEEALESPDDATVLEVADVLVADEEIVELELGIGYCGTGSQAKQDLDEVLSEGISPLYLRDPLMTSPSKPPKS